MASIFESLNQLEQLQMMLNNQYAGVSKAAAKAEAIAAGVNSQMLDISEISLASSAEFISATDGVNGIVEQLDNMK